MFCVLDAGDCIDGCKTEVDGMSCIVATCHVACVFMLHLYGVLWYFVGVAGRVMCACQAAACVCNLFVLLCFECQVWCCAAVWLCGSVLLFVVTICVGFPLNLFQC